MCVVAILVEMTRGLLSTAMMRKDLGCSSNMRGKDQVCECEWKVKGRVSYNCD